MANINRDTYCNDCERKHQCDLYIENNGRYVCADDKCYCKIVNGKMAEKYPWEE